MNELLEMMDLLDPFKARELFCVLTQATNVLLLLCWSYLKERQDFARCSFHHVDGRPPDSVTTGQTCS